MAGGDDFAFMDLETTCRTVAFFSKILDDKNGNR